MNALLPAPLDARFEPHLPLLERLGIRPLFWDGRPSALEGRFFPLWVYREGEVPTAPAGTPTPILRVVLDREGRIEELDGDTLRVVEERLLADPEALWPIVLQHFHLRRQCNVLTRHVELLKAVESLFLTQEVDKVFAQILQAVMEVLQVRGYSILLLRDPKKAAYDMYIPPETRRQAQEKPKYTFHPDFLDDILFSEKGYEIIKDPNDEGRKLLALPIRGRDRGMALAMVSVEAAEVDIEQVLLAGRFSMQLSPMLENLLLFVETKELTIKDDLTQTYNRRYFEAFIDEELERAKRYGNAFSIIFLDLDDLKGVNSQYGHLMGSRTLQEVATRILGSVRGVDRVVRFGGDEFCVILPHTTVEEALIVANRVREDIAEKPFVLSPAVQVQVTASMGIACFPIHGRTKETLIAKADQAMYEVKTKKKNAVGIARHG
jgi:diguanylate cyclase (GGDEF)-like protein